MSEDIGYRNRYDTQIFMWFGLIIKISTFTVSSLVYSVVKE